MIGNLLKKATILLLVTGLLAGMSPLPEGCQEGHKPDQKSQLKNADDHGRQKSDKEGSLSL